MIEILALAMSLLAANPRDELTYLPKDMCVELSYESLTDFVVLKERTEENCPEYHVFDLNTGSYYEDPLPFILDYELAVLTNEAVKRGIFLLKKNYFPSASLIILSNLKFGSACLFLSSFVI